MRVTINLLRPSSEPSRRDGSDEGRKTLFYALFICKNHPSTAMFPLLERWVYLTIKYAKLYLTIISTNSVKLAVVLKLFYCVFQIAIAERNFPRARTYCETDWICRKIGIYLSE